MAKSKVHGEKKQYIDKSQRTDKKQHASKSQRASKHLSANKNYQANIRTKGQKGLMCPVAKKCGGCQYQGTEYRRQLQKKEEQVRKLLEPYTTTERIVGMDNPFHYRNKIHAAFEYTKAGEVISGVYQEGTHHVVPVDECLIEDEKADAIIRDIRKLAKSFKIKIYNEDTGYGLLRHVLIRVGKKSGQIMVVLVTVSPVFPSKNNFVKALRKLHPEITTVVLNVNDRDTSMVLGERDIVLFGKGYIEDILCGKKFRISPQSFYQINAVQTEKLYGKAMELAEFTGKERIIDAYCGIGTIGLIASSYVKQVMAVELNKNAVRDAIYNAKNNGIKNVRFYAADAGMFMRNLAAEGEKVDVVMMDPPRAGSDKAFLESIVKLRPEKVVYISCNPVTLARDLGYLCSHGYQADTAVPFDLFPFTEHVETVCLLSRKAPV